MQRKGPSQEGPFFRESARRFKQDGQDRKDKTPFFCESARRFKQDGQDRKDKTPFLRARVRRRDGFWECRGPTQPCCAATRRRAFVSAFIPRRQAGGTKAAPGRNTPEIRNYIRAFFFRFIMLPANITGENHNYYQECIIKLI
jgi:hypothetical protein